LGQFTGLLKKARQSREKGAKVRHTINSDARQS
jgi:hypothetical protein